MRVMICPDSKSLYIQSLIKYLKKNGAEVSLVPWFGKQFPISFLRLRRAYLEGFKILHMHWVPFNWYFMMHFVRRFCYKHGIRMVWTIHNLRPHITQFSMEKDKLAMRFMTEWAEAGIVHYEGTKHKFQELYGNSLPLHTVLHGNFNEYIEIRPKDDARHRLGIPCDKYILLMFPPNRWSKGIRTFINVLEYLPGNYIGVMAGECRDRGIRKYLYNEKKRFGNRLVLDLNFVPIEKTHDYFSAADIFFMPYDDITTSGSVVYAMGYGKPIISTPRGNLPQLVKNGVNGYLCETTFDMKEAILSIDAKTADKMGRKSRSIIERFDWDEIARKTIEIYRSLDG